MINGVKPSLVLIALYSLVSSGWLAASSPWDGTWKLNAARSHLKPGELKIAHPDGSYRWDGPLPYSVACNGVSQQGPEGFSIACTEKPLEVRITLLEHQRPFLTTLYRIAPGGSTMQVTTEYMHGHQPRTAQLDDYVRASDQGTGLEGTWAGVRTTLQGPVTYVLRLHSGSLYYLDTMQGAVSEAKLDGAPAVFLDTHPDNVRWTNRWDGRRRVLGAYLVDGKPRMQEMLELSPDGRTLKNWVVGDEKNIYVLEKQREPPQRHHSL